LRSRAVIDRRNPLRRLCEVAQARSAPCPALPNFINPCGAHAGPLCARVWLPIAVDWARNGCGAMSVSADEMSLDPIALDVLRSAPDGAVPRELLDTLQKPNLGALLRVGAHFLATGRLDLAEPLYRALLPISSARPKATAGLASVASRRGDLEGALDLWLQAISEPPGLEEPAWFLECARVESLLGRATDAQARLHACRVRFPNFAAAAAAHAETLAQSGLEEEEARAWTEALRDFAGEEQPWWSVRLAKALRATGRNEHAEQVLDAMAARFPEEALSFVRRAELAARAEDWGQALEFWTLAITRHGAKAQPGWFNSRALALFRLWRIEEAMAAWRALLDRFPEFDAGYAALGDAARDLGWNPSAIECVEQRIARSGARTQPALLALRAECLFAMQRDAEAGEAIAALEEGYPESSIGPAVALRRSELRRDPLGVQTALTVAAARRFPDDWELKQRLVRVRLANGQVDEAEKLVADVGDDHENHYALIARWHVIMHRNGAAALEPLIARTLSGRIWSHSAGVPTAMFVLALSAIWSSEVALALLAGLNERHPRRVVILTGMARALIDLRRDAQALEIIDSIPAPYSAPSVSELRAWADSVRGDLASAKRRWRAILAASYAPAIHAPSPKLSLVTEGRAIGDKGGVTAFVPLRNERKMLPQFLNHHRAIGVRRFVCVENLSSDGSADYLAAQPDVTLYRTSDHFGEAGSGMRWINELIEKHGEGGWTLFADADEKFIYPGWEDFDIDSLIGRLDAEGAEGMSAFMLDVFPRRLFSASGKPTPASEYVYFDANYVWLGNLRSSVPRPIGGVRLRLFGVQEFLHKVPLMRADAGVHISSHETTALRLSAATGALLHYKLLALAQRWDSGSNGLNSPDRARIPDTMRRYQRYSEMFSKFVDADLRAPGVSQRLPASWELVDRQILQAPAAYRRGLGAQLPPSEQTEELSPPASAPPRNDAAQT